MKSVLSGMQSWLVQRVTAVYLGLFSVVGFYALISHPQLNARQWHNWLSQPWMLLALAIFIGLMLMHAWIGMRDVIMDYVHSLGLRIVLMSFFALFLLSCGLWAANILLHVGKL
ncbi:succinate dehydrogenase, hydrophobic membrane anchor protein [Acidihalobacter prosperus]